MTVKIVGDIGSCFGGTFEGALEAVDVAKDAGIDTIKFQLFRGNKNGNIEFPREYFPKVVKYARSKDLDIFASAFDVDAIELLVDVGVRKVKLAYSQNFNLKLIKRAKELGMEIFASGDDDNYPHYSDIKFYRPEGYPPKKAKFITMSDSDDILFDGLSSHLIGYKTDLDVLHGQTGTKWKYLEKHFHLDHEVDVPDYWFALSPKELKQMVKELK